MEVRDSRRTAWKKVADLKPPQTSYKVPDLDIGNDYFFRVTALNKEGASSPLQTPEATKITKEIGQCLLNVSHLEWQSILLKGTGEKHLNTLLRASAC